MRTWVVVGTAVRGALKVPEELDADGQMDAWASYRLDMTVPMERVTWRKPASRVDQMMDLARRVG